LTIKKTVKQSIEITRDNLLVMLVHSLVVVLAVGQSLTVTSGSTGNTGNTVDPIDIAQTSTSTAMTTPRSQPAPPALVATLRKYVQYAAVASYCASESPRPRPCLDGHWDQCARQLAEPWQGTHFEKCSVDRKRPIDKMQSRVFRFQQMQEEELTFRLQQMQEEDLTFRLQQMQEEDSTSDHRVMVDRTSGMCTDKDKDDDDDDKTTTPSLMTTPPVMAPALTNGTEILAEFSSYSSNKWAVRRINRILTVSV
jgi:hypothetical protein